MAQESPRHYTIVIVDIESFGSRDDPQQLILRQKLFAMMRDVLARGGVDLAEAAFEDRGDGAAWLIPSTVAKLDVIRELVPGLDAWLREHNNFATEHEVMRVRLTVHSGEVMKDASGYVGADFNTAFRLNGLPAARECLKQAVRSHMVVIASDAIYQAVIRHGHPGLDRRPYGRVWVQEKELSTWAWIYAPGYDQPPGIAPVPPDPPAKPAAGNGAPSPLVLNAYNEGDVVGTKVVTHNGDIYHGGRRV